MKRLFVLLATLFATTAANADWAYLRIVKPMREYECSRNIQMPEIFDFLLRVALKNKLTWSTYLHPKVIGCVPIDEKPMLFAHGLFEADTATFKNLINNKPHFESFQLEVLPLKALEVHYYLYPDAALGPMDDVFVHTVHSLESENTQFVKGICNGKVEPLEEGLKASPRGNELLPLVKESKYYVLFGYNKIDGILPDGSKIPILPFSNDISGTEWDCIDSTQWQLGNKR